ncbi:MAG: metallophosphoesterase family protein [Xanthobacteraceae bacterium]|nr:metallophosphoesterase family protein [Xanthobacteraceae bacterium]
MTMTYAIGDIHGSLRMLRALIARCRQHAGGRPMTFVFLGDYIDRGPDSAGVVRAVMDLQSEMPDRVVALKGNHEAMALDVIDGTAPADFWLTQGGAETLRSYGADSAGKLPEDLVRWLRSLRLYYDDGRRFFVHAGIDPKQPLDAQSKHDLIWIREPFLSDGRDHGRLIVHGHTPLTDGAPDLRGNRLNLDTAAVFGGPLTAAIFTDTETKPSGFLQVE